MMTTTRNRAMPRNSRGEKELKRRAVAYGKIAGMKTKNIARRVGCSKRYVRHLAAEPETRSLIAEAFRPLHAKLYKLAATAINVIEEALCAMKNGPSGSPDQTPRRAANL